MEGEPVLNMVTEAYETETTRTLVLWVRDTREFGTVLTHREFYRTLRCYWPQRLGACKTRREHYPC